MTRRDRIGLTALAVLGAALGAVYLIQRPEAAEPLTPDERRLTPETFTLEERQPRPGPRDRTPPEPPPPVLPPVDIGNGATATIRSVFAGPSFGRDPLVFATRRMGSGRRAGTSRPVEATSRAADASSRPTTDAASRTLDGTRHPREIRQQVRVMLEFKDPAPPHEQLRAVRVAGQVNGDMHLAYAGSARSSRAMATAVVDADVTRVPVEVSVPAGPFVEVERIAPNDEAATQAPGAPDEVPWRLFSLEEHKGRLSVILEPTPHGDEAFAGQSWQLIAVCHDGRTVLPGGFQTSNDMGTQVQMNVPMQDVAYVAYRYQRHTWKLLGEVEIPQRELVIRFGKSGTPTTVPSVAAANRLYQEKTRAATQATQPAEDMDGSFQIRTHDGSISVGAGAIGR